MCVCVRTHWALASTRLGQQQPADCSGCFVKGQRQRMGASCGGVGLGKALERKGTLPHSQAPDVCWNDGCLPVCCAIDSRSRGQLAAADGRRTKNGGAPTGRPVGSAYVRPRRRLSADVFACTQGVWSGAHPITRIRPAVVSAGSERKKDMSPSSMHPVGQKTMGKRLSR